MDDLDRYVEARKTRDPAFRQAWENGAGSSPRWTMAMRFPYPSSPIRGTREALAELPRESQEMDLYDN